MYIVIDKEVVPKYFIVCDFYDVETCFCWDDKNDKLVIFPYTKESSTRKQDIQILTTPAPIRKVQFFDSRAFLICIPQGVYKISRCGEFALLSKNALGMGSKFFQVLVIWNNGVYLDNKRDKSSILLFPLVPNASETIYTFLLSLTNTDLELMNCFTANWKTEDDLCIIAYHTKLYMLINNTVQLVYTSDNAIVDILPVKKQDKIFGLILLTEHTNIVILAHGRNDKLVFEKIHLGENIKDRMSLCAGFSSCMDNILWIICCTRSRTYYIRKELFVDMIQEIKVEERAFTHMQYYKPNIVLGLLQGKELVEISLKELENSLSISNDIVLHNGMFEKTDIIMEKICAKVKELDVLYEVLADEQDKLKRINLYASKQKLQINSCIEVSKLCNHRYLSLILPDKLPKNSYVVFTIASKNQNTFCMKKVTKNALTMKMSINENQILSSSSFHMDLITLINEERPWCLIQNFINSFPQELKRKRGPKRDKTVFIDKIISLIRSIVEKKELTMTKLHEIKRDVRAEL